MYGKGFLLGLCLLGLWNSPLTAQTVKFATLESEPYWASTLPENGFLAVLAREAFRRAGYRMELTYLPFARALFEAKGGDYHGIFGFYYTKEREADFLYSAPLFDVEIVFIGLKSREIRYKVLEDLEDLQIGTLNGADNGPAFNAATFLKKELATEKISNVRKLIAGRLDLIVEIKDIAMNYIAEEKATDLVEIVGKPLQVKPLYIGFNKNHPDSVKLRETFNLALRAMEKDGTLGKIKERFGIIK